MACGNGTISSPFFGCCPTIDPHLVANTWTASLGVTAWATPMSYAENLSGQRVCPTAFYRTKTTEFFSYADFDINQRRFAGIGVETFNPPNGATTTSFSGDGSFGSPEGVTYLLEESDTMFHLIALRSTDINAEGVAVNSMRVTLSDPFNPEDYWAPLMAALSSHFDKWQGEFPLGEWLAFYNDRNAVVSGHIRDIVDDDFFGPPADQVCGMDAYCWQAKDVKLEFGGGVNAGTNGRGRNFMQRPYGSFGRVWRRVAWDFSGNPYFEWQRDSITKWASDGCTVVRPDHCPRPFATRCIPFNGDRTGEGSRVIHTPPETPNIYGRTVRSNCL